MLVCACSDNSTLESLSKTYLWNTVRQFANSEYFWYLRTCFLMSADLKRRQNEDWKDAYYALEEGIHTNRQFTKQSCNNTLATSILIELGYIPGFHALTKAVQVENYETVRLMLYNRARESSQTRRDQDNFIMGEAIERDNVEIVSLLIDEGGISTHCPSSQPLTQAIVRGSKKIVARLLQDDRTDPLFSGAEAILTAVELHRGDILDLLLSDHRVRSCWNDSDDMMMLAPHNPDTSLIPSQRL